MPDPTPEQIETDAGGAARVSGLVLSLFPGLDMLGQGFEAEGFCVVRGPDVLWGEDVRRFHPPAGRFDGIIGGDPCQSHSALANLVRAKGYEPKFPDLTPEYARVIAEAQPRWFLRENVPKAPDIEVEGYAVHSFQLCNLWLDAGDGFGMEQMRKRRFWFGVRGAEEPIDLRRWIRFAVFELPNGSPATSCDGRKGHRIPDGTGGLPEGRVKSLAVTGAHPCSHRPKGGHGERYTLAEMLHLQGLPPDTLEHAPYTMTAKRKLVGNGVPIPMARALAAAVAATIRMQIEEYADA